MGLRKFKSRSCKDPGMAGKFLVPNMADISRDISQKNLICGDSFFITNLNSEPCSGQEEKMIANYLSVSLQSPVFISQTFSVLSYEPLTTFSSSTWIKMDTNSIVR